jgi:GNAT superfamily N-acetyltransferase
VTLQGERATPATPEGPPDPVIRAATADEVHISASILDAAAAWAKSQGRASWPPGWFVEPDGEGIARLRHDIESNSLFIVWIGDEPAATFALPTIDTRFWPGAADDALYLHRFGVRRHGADIGRRAVEWMVAEARRRGRPYLRLDCLADNPDIRRYYEACGFLERGETTIDGTRFSLYELPVAGTR